MSFPASTSFLKVLHSNIIYPLSVWRAAPANKGLSWILGTLAPFSSNRNSSAKTCPWPPKFLRWVFIYSYFISSVVIVIFPDHRYFLAFAWDLGNWIFRYFLFARFPLVSCQPPSNRFRNQEEAKWRYPYCHFSWLWSSYRRRSLSRSGLNLQFADCPCRFALVSLCSNS